MRVPSSCAPSEISSFGYLWNQAEIDPLGLNFLHARVPSRHVVLLVSRSAVELPGGILDGQYMIVYSVYLPDQLRLLHQPTRIPRFSIQLSSKNVLPEY